ncbi:MAG: YbaY family lipoprotein [Betaproteobacteria bacterium]
MKEWHALLAGALLAGALLLAVCISPAMASSSAGSSASARVTGTVTYRERLALPPGAVVKVQLTDVSRADAPAAVIGQQIIKIDGAQVPIAFEIPYAPEEIQPQNSYAVRAWLEDAEGRMRFTTDRRYAVITRSAPTHADVTLKALGSTALR